MARSFANVKLLSTLVSNALARRGSAATTQGLATKGGGVSSKIAKNAGEESVGATDKVSWVPDPKTGYYKPENTQEIDVAELRATLLNKKIFNN
ncbi:hypothetical protein L6164_010235 [Bauhinia variegata]|uniref:Uncharacterized protein n=1 Tax=Bauhinia variegata TaxID=167791 RepID=A0ACB9PLM2_BAUVA|nr:hypothetical protein L6164_010235 [Bauhinia variegata]